MRPAETFIDWIDMRQDHARAHALECTQSVYPGHRLYHGGVIARGQEFVVSETEDGKVYYLVAADQGDDKSHGMKFKAGFHEGSHSTKVLIHSDGRRVRVSGNVGRLDRPDNVWNYDFADTFTLANQVMHDKGLPAFTFGNQFIRDSISADDLRKGVSNIFWSGAHVQELHITRNYYAGSTGLAIESMNDMRGRRLSRVSKSAFGDETINFGMPKPKQRLHRGVVIYRKGPEMLAHAKGDDAKARIKASPEYQLAMDCGLIRVELKCGDLYLRGHNLRYAGDITMPKLIALFNHETAPILLARADNVARLVDAMPRPLRASALLWIEGHDMRAFLADRTFKRHRKALIEYGLDISEPRQQSSNAESVLQGMLDALPQHSLKPLPAPEWYGLPEVAKAA